MRLALIAIVANGSGDRSDMAANAITRATASWQQNQYIKQHPALRLAVWACPGTPQAGRLLPLACWPFPALWPPLSPWPWRVGLNIGQEYDFGQEDDDSSHELAACKLAHSDNNNNNNKSCR